MKVFSSSWLRLAPAVALISVTVALACQNQQPPAPSTPAESTPAAAPSAPPPAPAATDATAEAENVFSTRCVSCHGMSGKGDGVAGAALNPPPRNWTDVAWQDATGDEEIAKAIAEGGAAVGKSALMPPNPDLVSKPDVVKALVAKVRSFKGK